MTTTETAPERDPLDRLTAIGVRGIGASKKVSRMYLGGCEKVLLEVIGLQERIATATKISWVRAIAESQATVARELTTTYFAAARELVR
ncbi:hypothetical protein [Capillimicrobium parvum]|uniref:Uncharacterized protein n=1 Tax=Capillimicrobium parvum TaxID=2884022 RepID=A0A9E6XSY4_9ACTN|nr:hypothetical protein [Capillimicrobium parvum]UGS33979.1 hypothetical protein DSM104329_00346 [Capillimicrobium parvum]